MRVRELEESLARLTSVDAVRVVLDGDRVAEVHVVSPPDKPAKQVVRDIQSLAMARHGANIDRRVVSVVQIAPEGNGGQPGDRPKILAIEEAPHDSRLTATVRLGWRGAEYEGTAVGTAAPSARMRLVAEAALRALEEALGGGPPMALDAIGAPAVGMREVMVAVVVSQDGAEEQVAVGSALCGDGETSETAVRSVLDAMNRRIPNLAR
ncbi:MAG: hypothetical protein ACE5E8_03080 [Acidimicrobiia bacterium]